MTEITTIYRWRCSKCGRIFEDDDKGRLENFKVVHTGSHRHETVKWEFKGKVEKHFQLSG